MRSAQIVIVGAGASGMMAAITAARQGKKVVVLEKLNAPGKKILATGNGKCNYTNELQKPTCYRSSQKDFPWNAVKQFDKENTLDFFHEIGILPSSKNGYYYPYSGQAVSLRDALVQEMNRLKVEVHCEEPVLDVQQQINKKTGANQFVITTQNQTYLATKLILAVGGKASPGHGTTGDGYKIAKKLGHTMVPVLPALTSCVLKGKFMKGWTGVRIQGKIGVYEKNGNLLCEDSGELQMVAYGISGIPVFQISRFIAKALQEKKEPYLLMDAMPFMKKEEIVKELEYRKKQFSGESSEKALQGMLHSKLAFVFLKESGINPDSPVGQWTQKQMEFMALGLKEWKLEVMSVSDYEKAQVTCGGVSTQEISGDTMESNICPGLFVTGELLDVDGICGGYNLQWAWTSGYLAGKAASR